MKKLTKLIATLGPACHKKSDMKAMIEGGVDVFRLNTSHSDQKTVLGWINTIQDLNIEMGLFTAILLDLQGPKIRLAKLDEPIIVHKGDTVRLSSLPHTDCVLVTYEKLAEDVKVGQTILIDDGLVGLKVGDVDGGVITTEVLNDGVMRSAKGINLVGGGLNAGALSAKDTDWIEFACEQRVDYLGLSFVRDVHDFEAVKKVAQKYPYRPRMIAKIERQEAIDCLDAIIEASDGIMVARGDLAVEVGHESVPLLQKRMIKSARYHSKPVIVATQMLESMVASPVPTRAEVSDVANAVLEHASCLMLSAESATGQYPLKAVQMMTSISNQAEQDTTLRNTHMRIDKPKSHSVRQEGIVEAVNAMTNQMPIKAVVALTETGHMARRLSCRLVDVPIFGLSSKAQVCRWMSLYYGVKSFQFDVLSTKGEWEVEVISCLRQYVTLNPDDMILVTRGDVYGAYGKTNQIKLMRVEDHEVAHG